MIKRFFTRIGRAVSDGAFYREALKGTMSAGFGYVYWLLVMTSFIALLPLILRLAAVYPAMGTFTDKLLVNARALYPPELVLTVSGGVLSSNVPEPYFIDFPKDWETKDVKGQPEHLVAIDTTAHAEDYPRYRSLFFLTAHSLVMPDKNGTYKVVMLDTMKEPFVLNHEKYQQVVEKVSPYLSLLRPLVTVLLVFLVFVGPFALAGFGLLGKMIYLLILSLFFFWIAKARKMRLTYHQVYKLGLYALTAPILFALTETIIGFYIPFAYTALFILWMIGAFASLPKTLPKGKKGV